MGSFFVIYVEQAVNKIIRIKKNILFKSYISRITAITMKNQKTVLYIMIIGIICILLTPYLFTKFGLGVDLTSSNSNNIGGTIGGITAPFTGILGSLLVYFALREQVLANILIQKQLDEQKQSDDESKVVTYLKQQLDIIIKDIGNFYYLEKTPKKINGVKTESETIKKGSDAIYKYLAMYVSLNTHHNDENYSEDIYQLQQLENLITFIDDFVKATLTEKISKKDKTLLLAVIKYSYNTNIKLHFDYMVEHKSSNLKKCTVCQKYHFGIPDKLYEIIFSINNNLNF